jgi:rhodanese-related sulfurtransferase
LLKLIMVPEVNSANTLPDIPEISREELRSRLRDPSLTIVDVLPVESYTAGHIPGALNLPFEQVGSRAQELLPERSAEIALYCGKFT